MKRSLRNLTKVKEDDYISIYKYTDVETNELLGDGTTLIFIEMKKFCKSLKECRSEKERWICSLKSMGEQLEMPQELSGTILQTMYDKAALAAMPLEKRINYISKTMSRNDELNSRAEMIEDALQEGYAKGRDEGLAEGRADAAKRMVASGMTKEQVAAILQLSANELDTLFGS
jgi:predicted transposase/invertase (TIGR01784 family)